MKRFTPQRRSNVSNHKKKATANKTKKNTGKLQAVCEEPSGPDLINNLNDDCLARIFKYLSLDQRLTIEAVCKRWKDVSQLAWDDVKILNFTVRCPPTSDLLKLPDDLKSNQCIGRIIRKCGRYLHQLQLAEPCNSKILPLVGQHCHNLVKLEIELPKYDKNCAKLFQQMQRLKYLEMKGIRQHFSGEFFQALPYETLTEIHLWAYFADAYLPTYVFLPRVAPNAFQSLTKLTALTLNGFSLKPNMMKVISQKSELTFLSIANCSIRRGLPHLNGLTKLEHLNLTKVLEVADNFLEQIAENCSNMRHLNLSKCINVEDNGIKSLLKLSHLEELILNDAFKITDAAFTGMYNLKKLECESCDGVYDEGMISLIKYSANLKYLNLADTGVSERVIREAMTITKKRTNNLKLHLVVSNSVKEDWNDEDDFSPLLIVEGKEEGFDDESDSDFDVDDYYDEDEDALDYDYEYVDEDDFDMFNSYDDYEYEEGDDYALHFLRLV
ncbi:F-box/LRR-repeat protein 13 [Fopius arisanus]|uniref:F-box/LRR-repeat protein 13 n=1 Tax=Fopius arisanus TaxID=64838 RepID=A0A9R1TKK3_9HYME|nr:PREDICTED: F-box/LRR-repeat protein 13-like [Fopius arisanus]